MALLQKGRRRCEELERNNEALRAERRELENRLASLGREASQAKKTLGIKEAKIKTVSEENQ